MGQGGINEGTKKAPGTGEWYRRFRGPSLYNIQYDSIAVYAVIASASLPRI